MTILLSRFTYIHWYRFCFKRNLHIITVAAGETLWNGKNRQFWWSINWFLGKNVKFFWSLVSWTDSPSENTVHSSFKSKDTVTRKIWHFFLKISLSTIKIVYFCHFTGSPQRRRLRRRLRMSIAEYLTPISSIIQRLVALLDSAPWISHITTTVLHDYTTK